MTIELHQGNHMRPIQLFVPTFRVEETLTEIRECLEKGWTGLGFKTVEFEQAWQAYTGLPHAHFLSSATAGLHLAVRLLKEHGGWQDGDEIITTPLTFVSTNHAILYEKLQPVFADVDASLCLDPHSIAERVTPRTRAVLYVGMGGNTGCLEEVAQLCLDNGFKLILDASHMTGTRLHGRHVGAEADVSVFSFQAVKNLPTGDSGMICFADVELDQEVRTWTWLGINKDTYTRTVSTGAYKWHYDVEHVGFKYHGNSIMASMGLVSLRYVDQDNAYRRQLAAWYDAALAGVDGLEQIPIAANCEPSRHLYQVLVDHRDEVMLALNNQQIFPGVHYRDNTVYRMYSHARNSCPRSWTASERLISLPMHLRLTYADIQRICQALREIVASGGARS
jgi:dTDP-4-amino-4,6-dideoxygalactose transaminase